MSKTLPDRQVELAVEHLMNRPLRPVAGTDLEPEVHDTFVREAIAIFKQALKDEP